MSLRTRLVLLRHGEVEARYHRVFGGRIDMDLSPFGREQAQQLADYLRPVHFDAVYVSPLRRAQLTAQPLLATNGYQAIRADALREVDFGAWTGLTWDEVQAQMGQNPYDWLEELCQGRVPEGEPISDFQARVQGCLADLLRRHANGTLALVCHGGVIRLMLAQLLDLPLPKTAAFEIDYASVTIVDCRARRAEVQLLNFTPWQRRP